MAFAETFGDLRRRRRLKTTAWETGTPSPYVAAIEKKGLIPGREKLEALIQVFEDVAREQGAADPAADGQLLRRERERTFLIERAEFDPKMADCCTAAYMLWHEDPGAESTLELLETIGRIAEILPTLEPTKQQELLDRFEQLIEKHLGTDSALTS